jgi:XRE family aerobic/anaerobic benzoate catabolism transcriptional regulator
MMPRQLGKRLAKARKAKGMSQYALAKAAAVSREYVRKLEAGESDPTVGMLQRLATALSVKVSALVD